MPLEIDRHAADGMAAERPPVRLADIIATIEDPDHDDGKQARKWIGRRTVIAYYKETANRITVRGVSASRRRLAP